MVAPPYDVVSTAEALARATGKPFSFLHISRPEIDLPAHTDPYSAAVYAKGRENFLAQIQQGVLLRDPEPYYYVYRLTMGSHVQTGLVATASVQAYDQQRIRRHEFTRVDKEDDRVRQVDALGAQTGPAFLTYRHNADVTAIQDRAAQGTPDVDVVADDGVRHQLWVLRDRGQIDRLTAAFDAMRGGAGLDLEHGSRNNLVHDCSFYDISGSAIQIGNPVSYEKAVRTLREFNGIVEQATEEELSDAAALGDRTGMFNCPHTGVALAALIKLVKRQVIDPAQRVVVISTAHGLKFTEFKVRYHEQAMEFPSQYANKPIDLPPRVEAVKEALEQALRREAQAKV